MTKPKRRLFIGDEDVTDKVRLPIDEADAEAGRVKGERLPSILANLARHPEHDARIHPGDDGSDIFYLGCQRCVWLTSAQHELAPTPGRQRVETMVANLLAEGA